MPFVSRRKYEELVEDQELVIALEEQLLVETMDRIGAEKAVEARDAELNEVGSFLKYLATRVPDYEGYVLEYMEFQESSDD